jgi:hypothetical protein
MKAFVVTALLLCSAACLPVQGDDDSPCRDDAAACPKFSKEATKVSCDCKCNVATSLTGSRAFSGAIDTCLPPEVNRTAASLDERVAIDAMSDAAFSQRVFLVCSENVAHFVEEIVRSQLSRTSPICVSRPVSCRCEPLRAFHDGDLCDRPCPDVACTSSSCEPLLREQGTLDASACACSRVRTCGRAVPGDREPALCRVAP